MFQRGEKKQPKKTAWMYPYLAHLLYNLIILITLWFDLIHGNLLEQCKKFVLSFCLTACWFWTGATTASSLQSNLAGIPSAFCPEKTGALSALTLRYRSVDYIYAQRKPWTQRRMLKITAAQIEPRSEEWEKEIRRSNTPWADIQWVCTFLCDQSLKLWGWGGLNFHLV